MAAQLPSNGSTGEGRLAGLRVALVFPIFLDVELASHQDNARFLGSIPPLSLAYVASVLKGAGADVLVLDCPTLNMPRSQAVEVTRAFGPDYVGFTLATVDWLSTFPPSLRPTIATTAPAALLDTEAPPQVKSLTQA